MGIDVRGNTIKLYSSLSGIFYFLGVMAFPAVETTEPSGPNVTFVELDGGGGGDGD